MYNCFDLYIFYISQMIYALLDDELKNKGLHALSIVAKTPAEMIVK